MKILVVSDADFGGAGTIALLQAEEIRRQGHEVKILIGTDLTELSERWRNWRAVYNPFGVRLLRRTLREFQPDLVHIHNVHWKFSFASIKVAKGFGAKVFFTAHDTYLFYPGKYFGASGFWHELRTERLRFNPLRNFFIKRYVKYTDRVFAVSDALGNALRKHGVENSTIHNGIEASSFATTDVMRAEARERFKLGNAPTVLWVGRLSRSKGGAVLPAIMERVQAALPEAKLLSIGTDISLARAEMPLAYAAADVVIVPSVYLDPFPTVVLEAGASARPVVVTSMGGAREAVIEGETGYVADPYSPEFAERIIELLQDRAKGQAMGERALEHMRRNFSLETQVRKMVEYYLI